MSLLRFFSRFDAHHRLMIGLSVAGLTYFAASPLSSSVRLTLVWIAYAAVSLLLMWTTVLLIHPRDSTVISRDEDSSRTLIFAFVVVAALASLFAVVGLLGDMKATERKTDILLAGLAVSSAWALIHTLFTLRYAHLYYGNARNQQRPGGLNFLNEPEPDYLDFAYFSFIIGMTSQTADVNISSRPMRRTALVHGVLSFVFNVVIIAMTISGLSSLL